MLEDRPFRRVEIRLPTVFRVYIIGFMIFWCAGVSAGLVAAAAHGSPVVVIPLFMLAFGLGFAYRMARLSVLSDGDAIIVRNFFQTRRLQRKQIEGFRIGPVSFQPFGKTIHVLLRDNSMLPLDAAGRPYLGSWGTRGLDARVAELDEWLRT